MRPPFLSLRENYYDGDRHDIPVICRYARTQLLTHDNIVVRFDVMENEIVTVKEIMEGYGISPDRYFFTYPKFSTGPVA